MELRYSDLLKRVCLSNFQNHHFMGGRQLQKVGSTTVFRVCFINSDLEFNILCEPTHSHLLNVNSQWVKSKSISGPLSTMLDNSKF